MRKTGLTVLGTMILFLLGGLPVAASMGADVDLAWMTEKSIDIVAGEIVAERCELREDIPGFKEAVITIYTVRVTRQYKGELTANSLTEFAILGGEFAGRSFRASDMPEGLDVGVSGIFFLRDWEGLRVPSAWEFGAALHTNTAKNSVKTLGREIEVATLESEIQALLKSPE